jgi:hypothetical protein
MLIRSFSFILLTVTLLLSCTTRQYDTEKDDVVTKVVLSTVEIEEPLSPPPGFRSKHGSLNDWLLSLCRQKGPDTAIAAYNFHLTGTEGEYFISLAGENTYTVAKNHERVTTDFKPADPFYRLTAEEAGGGDFQAVSKALEARLEAFVKTEAFRNSFLAKAEEVIASGRVIWPRKF